MMAAFEGYAPVVTSLLDAKADVEVVSTVRDSIFIRVHRAFIAKIMI
jgi:hypothetical protein